jgi:hypothetical protein
MNAPEAKLSFESAPPVNNSHRFNELTPALQCRLVICQ